MAAQGASVGLYVVQVQVICETYSVKLMVKSQRQIPISFAALVPFWWMCVACTVQPMLPLQIGLYSHLSLYPSFSSSPHQCQCLLTQSYRPILEWEAMGAIATLSQNIGAANSSLDAWLPVWSVACRREGSRETYWLSPSGGCMCLFWSLATLQRVTVAVDPTERWKVR